MRTRKSFYRALRKVAKLYGPWFTDKDSDSWLRTTNEDNGHYQICPITAVAKVRFKLNRPIASSDARSLGRQLGLPEDVIDDIMYSADDSSKDLGKNRKIIKKTLHRAVGLTL